MSWEPAPRRHDLQRWIALGLVALLVALTILGVRRLAPRATTDVVTQRPTTGGLGAAPRPAPPDPGTFRPRSLAPLEATRLTQDGPTLPALGNRTLLVVEPLGVRQVRLASGTGRSLQVTAALGGRLSGGAVAIGDGVLTEMGGDVVRLVDGRRPVRVAADHRLVSTAGDRAVWVFDNVDTALGGTATRVGSDGTVGARVAVPARTRPIAGTADTLVVGGPGTIGVVEPSGSARLVAHGDPLTSDGEHIAWLDCTADDRCAIVLGTVDDPDRVRTMLAPEDLPAGVYGPPAGAFSPDGRWLALPVSPAGAAPGILVLDTTTGVQARRLPGQPGAASRTPLAWSPDSRWLVAATGDDLVAWQVGHEELRRLPVPNWRIRGLMMR